MEQGKLSLDRPVWDLLKGDYPRLPGQPLATDVDKITIKHLLQHSTGWDDKQYDPMFDSVNIAAQAGMPSPPDKKAIVGYMWSQPLVNNVNKPPVPPGPDTRMRISIIACSVA